MRGRRLRGGTFLPAKLLALLPRWKTREKKDLCAPPSSRRHRQGGAKNKKNKRNEEVTAGHAVGNRCPVTGPSTSPPPFMVALPPLAAEALPRPLLPLTREARLPKKERAKRAADHRPTSTLAATTTTRTSNKKRKGLSTLTTTVTPPMPWGCWGEEVEDVTDGGGRPWRLLCRIATPFDAWKTFGEAGRARL